MNKHIGVGFLFDVMTFKHLKLNKSIEERGKQEFASPFLPDKPHYNILPYYTASP